MQNYRDSSKTEYLLTIFSSSERLTLLTSAPDAKITKLFIAALEIASEMPALKYGNIFTPKH